MKQMDFQTKQCTNEKNTALFLKMVSRHRLTFLQGWTSDQFNKPE